MKSKVFEINILADNFTNVKESRMFGEQFKKFLSNCIVEFHESPVIGIDASYYVIKVQNTMKMRKEVVKLNRLALSDMYYIQREDGMSIAFDVEMFVVKLVTLFIL